MGVFLIVLNVLTGVLLLEFGAMKVYSHKVDFENNKTSGAGLAMGVREEEGEGCCRRR